MLVAEKVGAAFGWFAEADIYAQKEAENIGKWSDRLTEAKTKADEFKKSLDRAKPAAAPLIPKTSEQFDINKIGGGTNEAEKAAKKLAETTADLTNKLRDQVATFNMSAAAAEAYKLQQQHVGAQEIAEVVTLKSKLDLLKTEKSALEELRKAQAELNGVKLAEQFTLPQGINDAQAKELVAIQARIAAYRKEIEAIKEKNRIKDERQKVLDSLKSPQQKFADEAKRLSGLGLNPDQLKQALAKAAKEINSEGFALAEQFKTPMEKFRDEFLKLKGMLDGGQISPELFKKAVEAKQKELLGNPNDHSQFGAALELGSSEARSAILRNRFGGNTGIDKVAANTEQQVKQTEQLIFWFRKVFDEVKGTKVNDIS